MKGSIDIRVSNNRTRYRFTLNRNITIVRGYSGTGKTTLYDMIAEHMRLGDASGVQISSPCPCIALMDMDWQNQLKNYSDSVIFIDEGATYLASVDFAVAAQATSNYFVIFNRENLHTLPYSVEEIYEIKTSNKYHTFQKAYGKRDGLIYGMEANRNSTTILTEDSQAGYELYKRLYDGTTVRVETAGANSTIFSFLRDNHQGGIFVIADGAAFGSEIDRVMKLQKQFPKDITVCLPESFEWLILQSGIIAKEHLTDILSKPYDYVDSEKYFSWEQFFTAVLQNSTRGTVYKYAKNKLNPVYLHENNKMKILTAMRPLSDWLGR